MPSGIRAGPSQQSLPIDDLEGFDNEQLLRQLAEEREARRQAERSLEEEREASQKATASLRQSNTTLKEISESQTAELAELAVYEMENPHPVLRISMTGQVLEQNDAAKALTHFRFGNSELECSVLWTRLASVLESEKKEQTLEAKSNGRVYAFTARRIDSGGYAIIYGSDISEQKSKQKKVSNRLLKLIENLQSGVMVEDETRHVVQTNMIFCEMFGINTDPEQLTEMDWSNSDLETKHLFKDPDRYVARIEKLLKNRTLAVGDMLEMHDGRLLVRDYVPIYVDTTYSGNLWHFRDVTESIRAEETLRASEEKYRGIIENVNMGLVEVDLEGKIRYANQSFCQMSGFALDDLKGERASDQLSRDEDPSTLTPDHYIQGKYDGSCEVVVNNKSGQRRWWLFSGAPLYNDLQERIGSICLHIDITKQKTLERDLQEATQKAEFSVKAKERFLANMSHEIRTPMNAILGMSRQLGKTSLDEDQSLYLSTIRQASENLLVIINDILDLSKVNAGKLDIEYINFSARDVIHEAVNVLQHRAVDRQLKLEVVLDDDLAPLLVGDPHRINQVLLNLISNSIKFTEEGGIQVRCAVVSQTENAQRISIEVEDTGIGMGQEFLLKLFDTYSQEDGSIARKHGGTGLGMNISRKLIELMGGSIKVMSRKNSGTTVSFELELQIGEAAIESQQSVTAYAALLQGKRILLTEDNEFNRLVANLALQDYGVIVVEAHDGEQAITALGSDEFDLVLMDVQMPVMDGLEATRLIREKLNSQVPIIALSAGALKEERERCLAAGMNDFISKPFEEEDLVKVIARWIDTPLIV